MLLFIVLPCSFCSSSFRSSRLVATAGLRGSGGTEEGREQGGATTAVGTGVAVDTTVTAVAKAADVAVLNAGCFGEAGVIVGSGSPMLMLVGTWSTAGGCKRVVAVTGSAAETATSDGRLAATDTAGGWTVAVLLGVVSSTSLC